MIVSRQGMTRCPDCKSYIKVAAKPARTTCPFCQEAAAQTAPGRLRRSGKLALALLGAAALATASVSLPGCGSPNTTENNAEAPIEAGPENIALDAAYGIPPDMFPDTADAGGGTDAPVYGLPPDNTTQEAPNNVGEAAYGGPPDRSP